MQPKSPRTGVVLTIALTALYWFWEARAEGNIRVDLLLIYPLLFTCYAVSLWPKLRFWSLLAAFGLMAINFGFFVMSYSWFDKNPG